MDFAGDYMMKRGLKKPSASSVSEEMTMDQKVAHCINDLMLAATSFQRLHLKVKNDGAYAAHMALKDVYEALPNIADTIAEAYQGATEMCIDWSGESESFPKVLNSVEDAVSYIRELYERINMMQSYMPYSEIANELDELKMLLNTTKYKLLFLK